MTYDVDEIDWTLFTGRLSPFLDPKTCGYLASETILITGAGGSIGSALAKTVATLKPDRLMLLDHAEAGLAQLGRSLAPDSNPAEFILGDFRDPAVLDSIFGKRRVHTVFHAAACKHVPLLESNPFTAVSINALGTGTLIEAARHARTDQIVLVSTDKAVEPVSVLGVTKRIAELIALTAELPSTKVLRLCNVLGSTGSVAPVFREEIRHGGPITITHHEAKRYFITVEEAVCHLLHVSLADSAPALWVPHIPEQQSIESLAVFLMSSLRSHAELTYTGLRPGDKLEEKLWSEDEYPVDRTPEALVRLDTPLPVGDRLSSKLDLLRRAVRHRSLGDLLQALQDLVPAYRPSLRALDADRVRSDGAHA